MRSSPGVRLPTVSVVMPAYNAERTIGYAIDSVLNQSWHSFELIIVDDVSTDLTLNVATSYSLRDPRIRIISSRRNSRSGPIQWEPRNDGLQIAGGEFVAYLDSDNTWDPLFLEAMIAPFSDSGVMLTYCNSRNHYSPGEKRYVVSRDQRRPDEQGDTWTVFKSHDVRADRLGFDQYIDTNEMMHRTSVFDAIGSLWATIHPRRQDVDVAQGAIRPYRRHNDIELCERIMKHFGDCSAIAVNATLVDYYYSSFERVPHRTFLCQSQIVEGALELTDDRATN
jgi:glycosyltransferase involved in cell wall biosynthesis